jgi:hypothetical protein
MLGGGFWPDFTGNRSRRRQESNQNEDQRRGSEVEDGGAAGDQELPVQCGGPAGGGGIDGNEPTRRLWYRSWSCGEKNK